MFFFFFFNFYILGVDTHSCPCCHKPRKDHKNCSGIFCNNKNVCNKPTLHQAFLFNRRVQWCYNHGLDVSILPTREDDTSFHTIQLHPVTTEAKRKFKVKTRVKHPV